MDVNAVFSISYGLYVLVAEKDGKRNACIINTLQQVTQDPLVMSITVMKSNLTHDWVKESGKFSISVLGQRANLDLITHFGAQSGRMIDKFMDMPCGSFDCEFPLFENGCVAAFTCKVTQEVDLGTHTMFIADLVDAVTLSNDTPLTYAFYRDLRTGKATVPDAPVASVKSVQTESWQCGVCHYIYDGDIPFEDLPDDYVCPLCGVGKDLFDKLN